MSAQWSPEIMYEENDDGSASHIPFIMVPKNETMTQMLYVFESRETGEHEPGLDGEEVPVIQWDLHQYADMDILKKNLDPITYDIVRSALGLEGLESAAKKGAAISSTIREKLN